jgi:uncharacterized radical SAM protein YgiQ
MIQPPFLPMSREEMRLAGWDELDVLLISGDAYVDHPAFGTAMIGRWLAAHGFRVGVAAQPRWKDREEALADVRAMGRPRLFAGVTSGAVDSMLAHYTAFRKRRRDDAYTPGGLSGARPNRACIVYTGLARQAFPGLPVVLGGVEASLRRASHYDFWDDALRRPLLQESKADLLVYGMGERAVLEVARRAQSLAAAGACRAETAQGGAARLFSGGDLARACRDVPGTARMLPGPGAAPDPDDPENAEQGIPALRLPSHEAIQADAALLLRATLLLERHVHAGGRRAVQESGGRILEISPPAAPLGQEEMDRLYGLPFARLPHPAYTRPVPAWEMIRSSITTHRGCGGGCSFCSLALHQGRRISSRSRASILEEAAAIAAGPKGGVGAAREGSERAPRWAGAISDVGGPSANMWQARCTLPEAADCARASCLHPLPCSFFHVRQNSVLRLLRDVASLPGVRHVRVASGLRFDLLLRDNEALQGYIAEFTGGQLKVAPEHSAPEVLRLMRKPPPEIFEQFLAAFAGHCRKSGKERYVVPYLMSAFPGCTEEHMRALAAWLAQKRWRPQQVQCFVPTPGSTATAMFYAGLTPEGEALHVARSDRERLLQHRLLTGEPARRGEPRGRPTADGLRAAIPSRKNAQRRRKPAGLANKAVSRIFGSNRITNGAAGGKKT